jgi:hypothetical protein
MAKPPAHPWLADVHATVHSDADPRNQIAAELGDGSIEYVSPGSIPSQLGIRTQLHVPVPRGRSEGTEADSNSRQYASYGASNQPSKTNKAGK